MVEFNPFLNKKSKCSTRKTDSQLASFLFILFQIEVVQIQPPNPEPSKTYSKLSLELALERNCVSKINRYIIWAQVSSYYFIKFFLIKSYKKPLPSVNCFFFFAINFIKTIFVGAKICFRSAILASLLLKLTLYSGS